MFVIYEEWHSGIALWLSRKYSFGFVERNNSVQTIKSHLTACDSNVSFAFYGLYNDAIFVITNAICVSVNQA